MKHAVGSDSIIQKWFVAKNMALADNIENVEHSVEFKNIVNVKLSFNMSFPESNKSS